jgi:tetratricopeptide (TPR) repeat protein
MPILSAENRFRQGLAAVVDDRHGEALDHFLTALEIERERDVDVPDARYLSYYGLSLARVHGPGPEAIAACEQAVRRAPAHAALLVNLGRVYEMAGRTARALACFDGALRLAPEHRPLRRDLARIDRRTRPVIASLDRSHVLNRWLGTLRARWRPRAAHRPEVSRPMQAPSAAS